MLKIMNYCRKATINLKYFLACIIIFVVPCFCFAETSLEEIKKEYEQKDLEGRLVVIQKLEGRRDEETVDFLMTVAGDGWENWQVKVMSIQLLGKAKNPKAVDLLLEIFTSRSLHYRCPAIKTYAAIALGNFREDARIQDILIRGAQSDEPQVREASVQSLGKVGDDRSVPHLILLLNDHSTAIRLNAAYALERVADHRVIPFLKILSEKDSDEIVRNAAKNVLINLQNK
jgi:HEAT repeat protein